MKKRSLIIGTCIGTVLLALLAATIQPPLRYNQFTTNFPASISLADTVTASNLFASNTITASNASIKTLKLTMTDTGRIGINITGAVSQANGSLGASAPILLLLDSNNVQMVRWIANGALHGYSSGSGSLMWDPANQRLMVGGTNALTGSGSSSATLSIQASANNRPTVVIRGHATQAQTGAANIFEVQTNGGPIVVCVESNGFFRINTNSQLHSMGGNYFARFATNASCTIPLNFRIYACTGTTGLTFTLPDATTCSNFVCTFKDEGGNALVNNITVNAAAGQTIDGTGQWTLTGNYDSLTIYSAGSSGWFIQQ